MLPFFKKILEKVASKKAPKLNQAVTKALLPLVKDPGITGLFNMPASKIYMLTTYTTSFSDLADNLLNLNFFNPIVATNVYAYFNQGTIDIRLHLEKYVELLHTNKISARVEHDLLEVVAAYTYLKDLGD